MSKDGKELFGANEDSMIELIARAKSDAIELFLAVAGEASALGGRNGAISAGLVIAGTTVECFATLSVGAYRGRRSTIRPADRIQAAVTTLQLSLSEAEFLAVVDALVAAGLVAPRPK